MSLVTTDATLYWQTRHLTAGPEWVDRYWQSRAMPHRAQIIRALRSLAPFASVYEAGCNAGPNLACIRAAWPAVTLAGCDVNPRAVAWATEWLVGARITCESLLDALVTLAPHAHDVILSCYALAYLGPDDVATAISLMRRAARLGIVVAEPMGPRSERVDGLDYPEWRHPYQALMPRGEFCAVQPPADRLNGLIVERCA